jgi:hypothetical protein
MRPAHNKRKMIAQQEAFVTGVNDTVVNPNFSPGQPRSRPDTRDRGECDLKAFAAFVLSLIYR